MEVVIEVVAVGRRPREAPAHALLVGFDLGKRGARYGNERHVAMREMQCRSVEMIGEVGATRTAIAPIRAEHEVIDDQLAPPIEEIAEGLFAFGSVEDIILLDLDPGERAPLRA